MIKQIMIMIDGKPGYKCICGATALSQSEELKKWEMQHCHFSDSDISILTCGDCKKLSPHTILEKYEKVKNIL